MFRQFNGKDISDKDFAEIQMPHIKLCAKFFEEYIVPEYIAFYIASGYFHSSLWECSLIQHFNSAFDSTFNHDIRNQNKIIRNIIELLKNKYCLEVIEESPILKLKEI